MAAVELQAQTEGEVESKVDSLGKRQRQDCYLNEIIKYLETGDLPAEERRASGKFTVYTEW